MTTAALSRSVLGMLVLACAGHANPPLLDDQFLLAPGFHIYKAADAKLTGESYVLAFDAQGRLLVADGKGVRRLIDKDGDQVYDGYETIIESGLGPRGPQGLLVVGDRIYAVGNDGVQLYSGYLSTDGKVKHEGRIGGKFSCGGDHAAHELVYGHDGWIYFVIGDGGGGNASHVTEKTTSPVTQPHNASVFRFDPTGEKWECIGTDGRNGPNLSMNYLGELFTFDSDLEYLYGLPNFRPVRLNHWTPGARLGWGIHPQGHRNYFYDYWPAVLDVGRGTPTWGTIYEHTQLPAKFHDAVIACDYVWKETKTRRTGRLCAFPLKRDGSQWKAEMVVLADGKPDAKGGEGFALVDVEVAPDGSLMLTGHGQGIWRLFYDPAAKPKVGPIVPSTEATPSEAAKALDEMLAQPQPSAAWARARIRSLRKAIPDADAALRDIVMAEDRPARQRLTALRLLSADLETMTGDFLQKLAAAKPAELRGQAAWLMGIRQNKNAAATLLKLLGDDDAFVRRRACEAISRIQPAEAGAALVARLADDDRGVRYAAMVALAHLPAEHWLAAALQSTDLRVLIRVPSAIHLQAGQPAAAKVDANIILPTMKQVLAARPEKLADLLDVYRFASRFRAEIVRDAPQESRQFLAGLLKGYPHADADARWEQTRLLGEYAVMDAYPALLAQLESEADGVTHIHLLRALAATSGNATPEQAQRLVKRLADLTQTGWHTVLGDPGQKSVYYPDTMRDLLTKLEAKHSEAFAAALPLVKPGTSFAPAVYKAVMRTPAGMDVVFARYREIEDIEARRQLLLALPAQIKPAHALVVLDELMASKNDQMIATASAALAASKLALKDLGDAAAQKRIAAGLIEQFFKRPTNTKPIEHALSSLAGAARPGFSPQKSTEKVEAAAIAAREFWIDWYRQTYQEPFIPQTLAAGQLQSDEKVHAFLLGKESAGGNAAKGREVYLQVQCFACHGGVKAKQETLFGPGLAGVTKRLKRTDLADALVYPSKTVEDRFKATLVETIDGEMLSGIVTSENDKEITLVTPLGKVHTIAVRQVADRRRHSASPMPQNLLNALSPAELRDLLAFLEEVE